MPDISGHSTGPAILRGFFECDMVVEEQQQPQKRKRGCTIVPKNRKTHRGERESLKEPADAEVELSQHMEADARAVFLGSIDAGRRVDGEREVLPKIESEANTEIFDGIDAEGWEARDESRDERLSVMSDEEFMKIWIRAESLNKSSVISCDRISDKSKIQL